MYSLPLLCLSGLSTSDVFRSVRHLQPPRIVFFVQTKEVLAPGGEPRVKSVSDTVPLQFDGSHFKPSHLNQITKWRCLKFIIFVPVRPLVVSCICFDPWDSELFEIAHALHTNGYGKRGAPPSRIAMDRQFVHTSRSNLSNSF